MDKTQEMLERWCSAPGVTFKNAEAEEAFKKRASRIADGIQLKTPDRVPACPGLRLVEPTPRPPAHRGLRPGGRARRDVHMQLIPLLMKA